MVELLLTNQYDPVWLQVYDAIKEELVTGGRAYIICPLVGDSASKGLADLKVLPLPTPQHMPLETLSLTPP